MSVSSFFKQCSPSEYKDYLRIKHVFDEDWYNPEVKKETNLFFDRDVDKIMNFVCRVATHRRYLKDTNEFYCSVSAYSFLSDPKNELVTFKEGDFTEELRLDRCLNIHPSLCHGKLPFQKPEEVYLYALHNHFQLRKNGNEPKTGFTSFRVLDKNKDIYEYYDEEEKTWKPVSFIVRCIFAVWDREPDTCGGLSDIDFVSEDEYNEKTKYN